MRATPCSCQSKVADVMLEPMLDDSVCFVTLRALTNPRREIFHEVPADEREDVFESSWLLIVVRRCAGCSGLSSENTLLQNLNRYCCPSSDTV